MCRQSDGTPTYADDNDPYEGFNRKMFAVNMSLDRHILKPVAKGYLTVPQPVRASVRNFRNNLISPVTLSNDTMQGSWSRAGVSASRLLINTTVGVLGLSTPPRRWVCRVIRKISDRRWLSMVYPKGRICMCRCWARPAARHGGIDC